MTNKTPHEEALEATPADYVKSFLQVLNDKGTKRILIEGETWSASYGADAIPAIQAAIAAYTERMAGQVSVPAGQTPLDGKLEHPLLDVVRAGEKARDSGAGSPYHGHSLEHCLHAIGWVKRDLRIALDEAKAALTELHAEVERMNRVCDSYADENQRLFDRAEALAQENARLRELLTECANDLEAEVESRYVRTKDHPAMALRYERDMEPVIAARALIGDAE